MTRLQTALGLMILSVGVWLTPAHAQFREDGASIQALAMGDAVRSSAAASGALYFNPAGISLLHMYAIETGYTYGNSLSAHTFNVSVVDSLTNRVVGAGMGYSYVSSTLPDSRERDGHHVRFGISGALEGQSYGFYLGLGVHYAKLDIGDGHLDALAADVGLLFATNFGLRLGVVGHNLTTVETPELPRSLGTGISYTIAGFLVNFDTLVDFQTQDSTTVQYNWGAEYLIQNTVAVRAGFQLDQVREQKRFSAGIGYLSQYVGVDIGYMQRTDDRGDFIIAGRIKAYLP